MRNEAHASVSYFAAERPAGRNPHTVRAQRDRLQIPASLEEFELEGVDVVGLLNDMRPTKIVDCIAKVLGVGPKLFRYSRHVERLDLLRKAVDAEGKFADGDRGGQAVEHGGEKVAAVHADSQVMTLVMGSTLVQTERPSGSVPPSTLT
jgi:hypothetical protein